MNVNFRYVEEELRYLFDNSDMVALVYQREYGPLVAAARDAQPKLQHFVRIEWDGSDADDCRARADRIRSRRSRRGSPERDFGERSDDDVYLLYTGGTTGMPKGVMWRQEDVYFALAGGIDVFTGERVDVADDREREDRRRAAGGSGHDADPAAHARRRARSAILRVHLRRQHRGDHRRVRRRRGVAHSSRSDARQHDAASPATRWRARSPTRSRSMQDDVDLSSLVSFSSTAAIFSQTVKEQLQRAAARLPRDDRRDRFDRVAA